MQGPGKYIFDIGCEQHGEYIPVEQVCVEYTSLEQMLPFIEMKLLCVLRRFKEKAMKKKPKLLLYLNGKPEKSLQSPYTQPKRTKVGLLGSFC